MIVIHWSVPPDHKYLETEKHYTFTELPERCGKSILWKLKAVGAAGSYSGSCHINLESCMFWTEGGSCSAINYGDDIPTSSNSLFKKKIHTRGSWISIKKSCWLISLCSLLWYFRVNDSKTHLNQPKGCWVCKIWLQHVRGSPRKRSQLW